MTDSEWRVAYEARAREHWTPERVAELTGGKQLVLRPDNAPCLLRAMGLLDAHARMLASRVRKYRQINHLLSFLEPALIELTGQPGPLHLVDAGCGRSALGFLVAWWLQQRGVQARLLGVDRNPTVIEGCRERAELAGLPSMAFAAADLDGLDLEATWMGAVGERLQLAALLALHACDTATDTALALAVGHRARFFAVAPCCQAELARQWADLPDGPLGPVQGNPHLRRTAAATVTDAMRAELMRSAGYEVRAVEFVEAHHTPKNTLIYGHRVGPVTDRQRYLDLKSATGGCGITLEDRLT
jgi:hypothetical protein